MEIVALEEQQTGAEATAFTITEVFRRNGPDQQLAWTGAVPVLIARALEAAGFDLTVLLDTAASAGEPGVAERKGERPW